MMEDCISDSEEDESLLLPPTLISQSKVTQALSNVPENKRESLFSDLRQTRFSSLVLPTNVTPLSDTTTPSRNTLSHSNEFRRADRKLSNISVDSTASKIGLGIIEHNTDEMEISNLPDDIRHNISNDLGFFPSNINQNTSRRGLRKRNFASTHPYIADQAHWLGLSNVDYLNEIYRENPDLDLIVKLLNQNYIKNKRRFPTEEKYKAKNFYAFLGKKPGFVKDADGSSQFTDESSQPSFGEKNNHNAEFNDLNLSDDSESMDSDQSIRFFNRKNHSIIIEDDEGDEEDNEETNDIETLPSIGQISDIESQNNEDSDDASDAVVKVGGRFRKEKSVLRGTLPESAKRLKIYQANKSKKNRKRHENEYRRGLAIRKSSKISNPTSSLQQDLTTFVVDDSYYQENSEFYHNFEQFQSEDNLFPLTYDNILSDESLNELSDISDSSSHNTVDSGFSKVSAGLERPITFDEYDNMESLDNTTKIMSILNTTKSRRGSDDFQETDIIRAHPHQNDYFDVNGSAEEDNGVDPQFVGRGTPRSFNIRKKRGDVSNYNKRTQKKTALPFITKSTKSPKATIESPSIRKNKSKRRVRQLAFHLDGSDKLKFSRLSSKRIGNQGKRKPESNSTEKHLPTKQKRSQKDLLVTDYYFSRTPNTSTTTFEAESTRKFVAPKEAKFFHEERKELPKNFEFFQGVPGAIEFPEGFILRDVDITRIHGLKLGDYAINERNSFTVILMGKTYSFTLVNKNNSTVNGEKLLSHLSKILNDPRVYSNDQLEAEIYLAIKEIISWFLVLQEIPSEVSWTYLGHIIDDFSKLTKKNTSMERLKYFPYILLLYYIFIQISEKFTIDSSLTDLRYKDFNRYCTNYWTIFFQFVHINDLTDMFDSGVLSYNIESIFLMFSLFQNQERTWWPTINKSLSRLVSLEIEANNYLDILFLLGSLVPSINYSWLPFYTIYNACKASNDLEVHNKFIEIIYSLNEKFSWPLEEKLIIIIYSAVTIRKFANFEEERKIPELIEVLVTRDSIPNSTFFERFMHLLYCYVSSLPFGGNKKRLISKLFTSSHFHYQKNQKCFAMFVNRLNFILLLSQLSDVDLRNQVVDLVQQIKLSNDIRIYDITITGLQTYSEIATRKSNVIPFDSYHIMIDIMLDQYILLPGISKLWKKLLIIMERYFLSDINNTFEFNNHFMFLSLSRALDFNKFNDEFSNSIIKLILKAVTNIIGARKFNLTEKNYELISDLGDKIYSFLHAQMGRFPLSSQLHEERILSIVEESIRIWIRSTTLLKESNWNVLILQKYPYIGNLQSREKFVLFFFNELLSFTNLHNNIDTIVIELLRSLVSFSTSKYLPLILNSLMKSNHFLFAFRREYVPDQITSFQIQNFKLPIMSNLIFNIAHDGQISKSSKTIYLEELLKSLNEEYNQFFLSVWFVDYCRKIVESLQKHCANIIESIDEFGSLATKLGISKVDLNELKWQTLPLKERLVCLNNEISSAVYFGKDANMILDKYISLESFDLVYHLSSVYIKAVANKQNEKWIFVSLLLKYVGVKIGLYKVLVADSSFSRFLQSLIDLASLHQTEMGKPIQPYTGYRMQAFTSAFLILREAYYLFDGYKDRNVIKHIICEFTQAYETASDNLIIVLEKPFSNYKLFDIQQPISDSTTILNHSQVELDEIRETSDYGYDLLVSVLRAIHSSGSFSACIPFEMNL